METTKKNFRFLRMLEITAFSLLVGFVVFFLKSMIAAVETFQSDAYSTVYAGLKNI
jgi:hypothetical protein